jgi:CHAD domain-containing protein
VLKNKPLSFLLLNTWNQYEKQVRESRSRVSKNNIHKLRILTQKLEALLTLSRSLNLNHNSKNILFLIKKVRKSLGPLRDIQVQSKAFEELTNTKQERNKHKEFSHFLAQKKKTATKKARKCLSQISLKHEHIRIKMLSKKLIKIEAKKTKKQIQYELKKTIQSSIKELNNMRTKINPKRIQDIHRFRIYAKKLRYQGEFLNSSSHGPKIDLNKLKTAQSATGRIQNDRILLKTLDHFLSKKNHSKDTHALGLQKRITLHQSELINKNFKELSPVQ